MKLGMISAASALVFTEAAFAQQPKQPVQQNVPAETAGLHEQSKVAEKILNSPPRSNITMSETQKEKLSGVNMLMPNDPNGKPPEISFAYNGEKLDIHHVTPGLSEINGEQMKPAPAQSAGASQPNGASSAAPESSAASSSSE